MRGSHPLVNSPRAVFEKGTREPEKVRFMIPSPAGGWQGVTWGDFLRNTEKAASSLSRHKIGAGNKTAILAKTRVEWAYWSLAIQACRAVLVPIYHSSTPAQIKYVLNHSDAEILITETEFLPHLFTIWNEIPLINKVVLFDLDDEALLLGELERFNRDTREVLELADISNRIIPLRDVNKEGEISGSTASFEHLLDQMQPDDVSAILYTSGTTGDPRGVVLTNENLLTNTEDWLEVLGPLIPDKRTDLLWLPLSHIFGWGELGLGNILGFTTYVTTPKDVLRVMPEVRPTIFMSVPAYWEKLYREAKAHSDERVKQIKRLKQLTGGELQFCLSGGAGLKREVKELFHESGLLIIEGYGLTECSPTLTMNRKDDFDFDSVGKPFPRVELKLSDDGEILAKGPNVFKGYYKDPASTREAFDSEGWFRTGDIGERTEKGFLRIKGRKKEIIVTSGGKNISPEPIELHFKDDPYIEHIVLYGSERKYLVALVTLKEEALKNYAQETNRTDRRYSELLREPAVISLVQERISGVNRILPSFETIKKFHIHEGHLSVEEGHLTPSMKLRRNKVCEIFKDKLDALYC